MSTYDQHLLDEAPKATRAQLQEGYSVDLLEQPPRRTSVRSPPPQTPQPGHVAVPLTPDESGEKLSSPPAPLKARTSFWRTRNGVITVFVISLIVIGAVVGGAVGGTVKKSTNNGNATGVSSSSSVSSTSATGSAAETQGAAGENGFQARDEYAKSPHPDIKWAIIRR
ncbi:hypothetical protein HD554DRAFT_2177548 [Boletus coccyginus]|nr:hypothetical protein HD554DRAFT_2177548 [Boletus coccyginus]